MPPEVLIDGLGDVGPNVIGANATKLRASTGPTPQWSTMTLRDFGPTRAQFIAGKRVTVRSGSGESAPSDTSGEFADNRADAGTILNPPLGVTTIVADVSGYTAEEDEPDALLGWQSPRAFTAWIKVVLTEPATLRFDTYGSGMEDTILAMFAQSAVPGADAPITDINDDTQEAVPPEDSVHSLLPDGGDGYTADGHLQTYAAGTYWLTVFPYAGDGWDTSEATIHLNITRSDAPVVLPVVWAGYVLKASRQFWFDVDDPETLRRRWVLTLVDVNYLFSKRIAFKQSDPGRVFGPVYKTPAYDDDVIAELVSNWLDLSADDLDVSSLIERVGIVNPSVTCASGQTFYPWNGGSQWGDAMEAIAQVPAAVYGFVPGEPLGSSPFARLFYGDADSADAPVVLTDLPIIRGTPEVPAETLFLDDFARTTTSPDIGNGWTQNADGTGTFGPGVIINCDGSALVKGQTAPFSDRATYSRSGVTFGAGYVQYEFYVPALVDYAPFSQCMGAVLDGSRAHPVNVFVMPNYPADGRWLAVIGNEFGNTSSMGSGGGVYFTPDPDNWYVMKAIITETTVGLRVWKLGDPEPGGYTFSPQNISGVSPFGEPDLSVSMLNGAGSSVDIRMRNLVVVKDAIPGTADTPIANAGRYRECTIWDDFTDPVNEEFAWGAGKGSDHMVFKRTVDADSIAEHGLWQRGDTLLSVWCQDTIDAISSAVVNGSPESRRGHRRPVKAVDLVTYETGLQIGQKARFINNDYGVDVVLPIRTAEITFPTPETMRQVLHLSEALDRWGFEDPSPPFKTFGGGGGTGGGGGGGTQDCAPCWVDPPDVLDGFNRLALDDPGCTPYGCYTYQKVGGDTTFGGSTRFNPGGAGPPPFGLIGTMHLDTPPGCWDAHARWKLRLPISRTDGVRIEFDFYSSTDALRSDPAGSGNVFLNAFMILEIGYLSVYLGDQSRATAEPYAQTTFVVVKPGSSDSSPDFSGGHNGFAGGVHVVGEAVVVGADLQITWTVGSNSPITYTEVGAAGETHDYLDLNFNANADVGSGSAVDYSSSHVAIDNLKVTSPHGNCTVVPQCSDPGVIFAGGVGDYGCETPSRMTADTFVTSQPFVPNSTFVVLNGTYQRRGVDYTETDPQTIVFTTDVGATDTVTICYSRTYVG